jgi:hypothetical protein
MRLLAASGHTARSEDGAWPTHLESAVEFIAVPSIGTDNEAKRRSEADRRRGSTATAARLRAPKVGAGLETELSDARRPDVLPQEMRRLLPPKGLVNYLEASAIVRELETLIADAEFRCQAEKWRNGRSPAIAVIALYAAQAELIRHLLANSPGLSASPIAVEVGTPDHFRQRECLAALISLTRSHAQRPVSFGDGPNSLVVAFTRPRARLLVFGDVGSLERRSRCAETVDHLDPAAAARERALVSHLFACIQGHGEGSAGLRLRQGPGS